MKRKKFNQATLATVELKMVTVESKMAAVESKMSAVESKMAAVDRLEKPVDLNNFSAKKTAMSGEHGYKFNQVTERILQSKVK